VLLPERWVIQADCLLGGGKVVSGDEEIHRKTQDGGQEDDRQAEGCGEEGNRKTQDGGQEDDQAQEASGQEGNRKTQDGGQEDDETQEACSQEVLGQEDCWKEEEEQRPQQDQQRGCEEGGKSLGHETL
jgi:hypothetical protein